MLVVAECMMILTVRVTVRWLHWTIATSGMAQQSHCMSSERKPCWDVDEEEDGHNASRTFLAEIKFNRRAAMKGW